MKTLFGYLKGIPLLFAIVLSLIIVGVFLLFFSALYALAVAILLVLAVFVVPYYVGRKDQPEQAGEYKLKDIKE
tara:strand:- start:6215 stop:6436 length:222 start_codon:yes stop_codon:yes gene_type:complete